MDNKTDLLQKRLIKTLARTSIKYGVLAPDDRVLVAVSGGKDSYALVHLLHALRPRLPFRLSLVALHVDQGQPGHQPQPLRAWLEQSGIEHHIVAENTFEIVKRHTQNGQTPCAICSRLRRGILYTQAKKLGCNKVALGHHRDDTLATFLLNLFYAGKLQAMPPIYTTDDGDLQVIRPLIEAAEADLATLSNLLAFPILPCTLCGSQPDLKRGYVDNLVTDLEKENPQIRNIMLGALKNVRSSHLLDPKLQQPK